MSTARTLFEKIWDEHLVRPETESNPAVLYVDLHLVHEVTSPQAFTELRKRGAQACGGRDRTMATMDHSTPTTPAAPPAISGARHAGGRAAPAARDELRRVRHPSLRARRQPSGNRPRHRARAGAHAARHDDRLRRQPHQHPRRVRRARVRHRHVAKWARARDAEAAATEAAQHGGARRGQPSSGRYGEGYHPCGHRQDRRRRRHRPRARVHRLGHPRARHGRAHDHLQHVHRGWRARRS